MIIVKKITQYKGMVSCYKHRKNVGWEKQSTKSNEVCNFSKEEPADHLTEQISAENKDNCSFGIYDDVNIGWKHATRR